MKICSLVVLLCILQATLAVSKRGHAKRTNQNRQMEFDADKECMRCTLGCVLHLGSCKECIDSPNICPNGKCTWKSNKCPNTMCLMEDEECPTFYLDMPGCGCDCNEGYLKCLNGTCVTLEQCNEHRKAEGMRPRTLPSSGPSAPTPAVTDQKPIEKRKGHRIHHSRPHYHHRHD